MKRTNVLTAALLFFVLTSIQAHVLEFTIEPQDTVVQSGHSAVLDCVVRSPDFPSSHIVTQWLDQDHQPVTFVGDTYRSQLTNGSLYISSVIEEAGLTLTGAYQCKASLHGGASIVSRTAHLSLASLSGFHQEPQDLTVYLGQKAYFACRVQGSPPPRIKWLKDERPLQLDEIRMTILPSGALEIDEVKESDLGSYRCNASSFSTHILSNKANLIINDMDQDFIPTPPSFIAFPRSEIAIEGQTVTLDCAANGYPEPSIKWLKDGYNIDMADLDSRFSKIATTSSLKISNIKEEDAGTYQCRAENREDGLDASATIEVQVPPKFLKKPQHQTEMINKDVEMECSVVGKPAPKVYWLKNGEVITTNEYYQVVNGYNLKIMGLMKIDTGVFQCVASNPAGNVQAAANLLVTDGKSGRGKNKPNRRKKTKPVEETSRVLFDILRPDKAGGKLGDVNFGFAQPHRSISSAKHHGFDPHSILTSLQSSDSTNNKTNLGDTLTAFTESSPSSKPFSVDDAGHLMDSLPGAPQDLTAVIVKARFVVLNWKPPAFNNDEIITYAVYYRQEGSERERVQNTTRARLLEEISIINLQPSKVYHFRVVAYNALGMGSSSDILTVTTQSEENVPSSPRDFEAFATSTRSMHVSWKPPQTPNGNILRYKIYYMETSQSIEYTAETPNLEYDIISLGVFAKYNVWVIAINQNGPGASSEEKIVLTFSDEPSEPPYNVTLEAASSTSIIVRWEPPPVEGQNGIITGYKLRYRVQGKKGSNTIVTPGNSRIYTLTELERASIYQVKLWAMNINGTGPPTDWYDIETYEYDLDESKVPDQPSPLKVRPASDKIYVMWNPPSNQNIRVRNYILGWGKGIPDMYTQELDEKQRLFIIDRLEPNSEYVISLRASNEVGAGPPVYANVRTREELPPDLISPLIPPIGLKAQVLSATSVILYWVDTTLSKQQYVRDNRHYIVQYSYKSGKVPKSKYVNITRLNVMIDDLKSNTPYEFCVKLVKGNRESPWSMVVTNTTWDVPLSTSPRDLTVSLVKENTQLVELTWQPPKQHVGQITGYIIFYTTDNTKKDREWSVQAVKGDRHKFALSDLKPSTVYFFKIQARNSQGNGPFSPVIQFKTGENIGLLDDDAIQNKENKGVFTGPMLLILMIVGCLVTFVTVIGVVTFLCCRRKQTNVSPDRSKKGYQKGTQNMKPPDLWIHHDQMELKNLDKGHNNDGASSSGAMTLPRSVGNEYDERDNHHTNSLDKRTYVPNYMGLTPDEKNIVKPKPITLPVDCNLPREAIATATPINSSNISQTSTDSTPSNRPSYPRTQYTVSRAHVTLDPNTGMENPYALHPQLNNYETHNLSYPSQVPPPVAHIPPSGSYAPGLGILAESQAAKRIQAPGQHPLKSFTVPAPPPISAPGTPQPKHVVTPPQLIVRPNVSPYKKAPSSSCSTLTNTPPSRVAHNPPPHTLDEVQKLHPSHSTEELNQEMANLEGLMMTLNAITANEFEC